MLPIDALNTLRSNISEIVRMVLAETERYDSMDLLLDLLVSTVVPIVEEHLSSEYDRVFKENIEGKVEVSPEETARTVAIYATVGGKTFADRIADYAQTDLDRFVSQVVLLAETDGHRCRSEGTLAAGRELLDAGFTVRKSWHGVLDPREREKHVALEGVTLPLDGYFEIDGHSASAPGHFGIPELDCNCRCELKLIVDFIDSSSAQPYGE